MFKRIHFGDENGSALIESAATLTAFLTIFFGVMDCSRALYTDLYVGYVARAAAHYAMVRGSSFTATSCTATVTSGCMATNANVAAYAVSLAPLGINTGAPLTVTTKWPGTTPAGGTCINDNGNNSPGCVVQVTVSYNFGFVLPFLPRNTLVMASSSAVTIAQ